MILYTELSDLISNYNHLQHGKQHTYEIV